MAGDTPVQDAVCCPVERALGTPGTGGTGVADPWAELCGPRLPFSTEHWAPSRCGRGQTQDLWGQRTVSGSGATLAWEEPLSPCIRLPLPAGA